MLDKYQACSYGPSSKKHPGQGEMQFFNAAELLSADETAGSADTDTDDEQTPGTQVPAHTRKKARQRKPA
jgi:hypothetical protein